MTAEQAQAAERLRWLPGRYRVLADVEGWPIIPGRYGRVEWDHPDTLTVFSNRPRLFAKLLAVPGVRRYQTGDEEARMLVVLDAVPQVAAIIKARRKRAATAAGHLGDHAFRSTRTAQEPTGARAEGGGEGAA
jgi:hypothetical protein